MVNVIYNDGIPDAPNNPSQDQPKMQTNTNSLRSLIEIDHVGFGNNQGGYHKVVHLTQQLIDPPVPIGSVSAIYAKQINQIVSDEALFYLSGGGRLYQLTMNVVPVLTLANSITFLPGGLLMQFGVNLTDINGNATINLTNSYGNVLNIFNVQATTSSDQHVIIAGAASASSLTIKTRKLSSGSGDAAAFSWMVIGTV